MCSADAPVALVKYDGTINALRKAIELCNGFEKLKKTDKVLLKPNLSWASRMSRKAPKYGFLTTSTIVENVIQLLREQGCQDISIGEGTIMSEQMGSDTFQAYRWSGIERVAREYGVRLLDFNKESHRRVELADTEVWISQIPLESDFLINLPVLKTHFQTTVSLGMKNLKGCLHMKSRRQFHRGDLDYLIALLNTQVEPNLTIIDGIYAMEHGPDILGTAHRMNLLVAGKDSLSCDMVGSAVLGIAPSSVGHLREFASIAKRSLDLERVNVTGENIRDVAKALTWDRDFEDIFHQSEVKGISFQHPGKHLCSGCLINVDSVLLAFCKENVGITLDNVEICCGADVKPKQESRKVFLIGDCSIRANNKLTDAVKVKGCPPNVRDMYITFTKHTLDKRRAARVVAMRLLKAAASKLGFYGEDFPVYRRYRSAEFDKDHY